MVGRELGGFSRMVWRGKGTRRACWNWLLTWTSLPAPNVPYLSHSLSCRPEEQALPKRHGQRASLWPFPPGPLFSGRRLRQHCEVAGTHVMLMLWSPGPTEPIALWQLPGTEARGLPMWHILQQSNNWEIWWTLTGGRREWKGWNKDAIFKVLAHVQDFTIFDGEEWVKKSLLLMSISAVIESQEARGFWLPSWGTYEPDLSLEKEAKG